MTGRSFNSFYFEMWGREWRAMLMKLPRCPQSPIGLD